MPDKFLQALEGFPTAVREGITHDGKLFRSFEIAALANKGYVAFPVLCSFVLTGKSAEIARGLHEGANI